MANRANQRNTRKRRNRANLPARQQQPPAPRAVQPPLPLNLNLPPGVEVTQTTTVQVESFQGPVPHPEILRRYEEILPGSSDRILTMSEKEQDFRHRIVEKATDGNILREKRGQWMAWSLAVIGLLIAGFLIYQRNKAAVIGGAVLGTGDLGAMVGLFLYTQRADKGDQPGQADGEPTPKPKRRR